MTTEDNGTNGTLSGDPQDQDAIVLAELAEAVRARDTNRLLALDTSVDRARLRVLMHLAVMPEAYVYALRQALEEGHHTGVLGREVESLTLNLQATLLEIHQWDAHCVAGEPVIDAIYRYATDPIGPRIRVVFRIAYVTSVDGTRNLLYTVSEIVEEGIEHPQGA